MKSNSRLLAFICFGIGSFLPIYSASAYESPLRSVCTGSQHSGQNTELAQALNQINGVAFNTPAKRKANKDSYYQAIKKVILATSSGEHLIDCLEKNTDSRFADQFDFIVHEDMDGLTASFEYIKDPQNGKYRRHVEMLSKETPLAAISFVAHEMQHSCAASKMLTAEGDGSVALAQLHLVDEMRAYKLQADFFLELARQEPALVCEKTAVPSKLFPLRNFTLQDLMAEIDETIKDGTFYQNVISAYIGVGLFESESQFYTEQITDDDSGVSTVKRTPLSGLVNRFEAAGLKITAP